MLNGIVIMKWDNRTGTNIIAKYPDEIQISDKTLMQVYSTHEFSQNLDTISLLTGTLNLISFYTGPETLIYIILLLSLDDDPETYEEGMSFITRLILTSYREDPRLSIISSIFHRISVFPTLKKEQLLAQLYLDETKRIIINRLRDEGVISKSELNVWFKDKYRRGFANFERVISELIKKDIIKQTSVKGMASELIFFTNDILMLRRPPIQILKTFSRMGLSSKFKRHYLKAIKKFFQTYRPSEEDNLKILNIIVNPQTYQTLRLLRMTVVNRDDLAKLRKKGVDDIDLVLKDLKETQMIHIFQDNSGKENYSLLSDFHLSLLFPKYLLNMIKGEYERKFKADQVLIEYLKVLKDWYLSSKSKAKSKLKG